MPFQFNCCGFFKWQKKAQRWMKKGLILPTCFSLLISLKTVNEQRQRKVGELLWLSNEWDSVRLVRSQAVSRPYLFPMIAASFPICITVFQSKLCWTTKKSRLCILHLLCSNVSNFFPCGLSLIRGCMHISSTDKKLHHACSLSCLQRLYVMKPMYVYMNAPYK